MSIWNTIKLSEINPDPEIIPAGEYTFAFVGAKANDNDPNKIDCSATIVDDGDFTGRRMFFSYPNPATYDWSLKAMKRLESALGLDIPDGVEPQEVLNTAGGTHFKAQVIHRPKTDEYPARANMQLFSVQPSA